MAENTVIYGVIPARLESTRLRNKPLQKIGGKTLLEHCYNNLKRVKDIDVIFITVPHGDTPLIEEAQRLCPYVILTSRDHANGTERVTEAMQHECMKGADYYLILQADEPLLPVANISFLIDNIKRSPQVNAFTIVSKITSQDEISDSTVVKAYVNDANHLIDLTRAVTSRFFMNYDICYHRGIYLYKSEVLTNWMQLDRTEAEKVEGIEMLHLCGRTPIQVDFINHALPPSIDTPNDLAKARDWYEARIEH